MARRLAAPEKPTLELKTDRSGNHVLITAHHAHWMAVLGFLARIVPYHDPSAQFGWAGAIYDDEGTLHMLQSQRYDGIEALALETYPTYRIVRDGLCVRP